MRQNERLAPPGMFRKPPIVLFALASLHASCSSFEPRPLEEVPFREREKSAVTEGVRVSVAVPTMDEAEAIYGVRLASKHIQPIWLEVTNDDERAFWFLPAGMDEHHFSPREAAYAFHRGSGRGPMLDAHFEGLAFKNPIMPGETVSGFVLVNLDEGYKAVDVDLICRGDARSYTFVFVDPDFSADVKRVDIDALWAEDDLVLIQSEAELRAAIENLPQCTTNKGGTAEGDPLNLVLVGERSEIFGAMVRRGWHATEFISSSSVWRTIKSFLAGSRYRYSPISPLYVYGRPQDFSAQKVRGNINERNHMRFWKTPLVFRGRDVWVGQISRDIGVKFTLKSPTISTHVIDPAVDEARRYLVEDLAYSQSLDTLAFARGVGEITQDEPRFNLVGDPYFTDGYRAVMFFEPRPNTLADIGILPWEIAGHLEQRALSE